MLGVMATLVVRGVVAARLRLEGGLVVANLAGLGAGYGAGGREVERLLVPRDGDLEADGGGGGEDDLRRDLDDPRHGLVVVLRPIAELRSAPHAGLLPHVLGDDQLALPRAGGLDHGLELGHAIAAGALELLVGVEGGGVGGGGERVGPVDEGAAEYEGRGVADAQVEALGRREDAVPRGDVGDCVADDFTDLDVADLVDEQHGRGRAGTGPSDRSGGDWRFPRR